MHRKITPLWGEKKVVLRQTLRAVTPFGGLSVFIEFLGKIGFAKQVSEHLPIHPKSPHAIDPAQTLTAFLMSGVAGARRFAHTTLLRADRALQALLGMKRFPTDDTIRNLFKRFKQGLVVEFLKEALAKLESLQGIRRVRADSGFFAEELLKYLEGLQRGYIVVAKLTPWLKREAARVTEWRALDATYTVGEFRLKLLGWDRERRFGVVREEIRESKASRGRKWIQVPGYTFRIFVTNLPDPPEEIGRDYNQRACVEQRIEELKSDVAADDFCLREFFATEAAFLSILMLFNLLGEFQRASGMSGYRQPARLRVQVFLCGAILDRAGHRVVVHLSAAWGGLEKRNPLLDKLLPYEIPTSPKLVFQPPAGG